MRESRLSSIIFVALIALLLFALYVVLGGDLSFLDRLRRAPGAGNLLAPFTDGLRALGQGLSNAFSRVLP